MFGKLTEREDFLAYVLALAVIDTEQGTLRRSNVIEVKSGLVKEKFFIPDALGIDDNLVEKFNVSRHFLVIYCVLF